VRPDSAAPRSSPSVSDGNRRLRCSDPRVLAVVLSVPLSLLGVAAALGVAGVPNNLYTQIGLILLIARLTPELKAFESAISQIPIRIIIPPPLKLRLLCLIQQELGFSTA
jgi:hypothetical protein